MLSQQSNHHKTYSSHVWAHSNLENPERSSSLVSIDISNYKNVSWFFKTKWKNEQSSCNTAKDCSPGKTIRHWVFRAENVKPHSLTGSQFAIGALNLNVSACHFLHSGEDRENWLRRAWVAGVAVKTINKYDRLLIKAKFKTHNCASVNTVLVIQWQFHHDLVIWSGTRSRFGAHPVMWEVMHAKYSDNCAMKLTTCTSV